jgi:hypothetical protein
MKTKIAIIAIAMSLGMIRATGQSVPEEYPLGMSNISIASPPTFETTTSGLDIKVWVMTQAEHQKMMEGMDNEGSTYKEGKENKPEGKKTSMSGTHHIKVVITDAQSGDVRNGISAKVEITPPSKKTSWIDLKNMSDHYGSDLSLKEKGAYMFTIKLDDNGTPKTTQFKYTVM